MFENQPFPDGPRWTSMSEYLPNISTTVSVSDGLSKVNSVEKDCVSVNKDKLEDMDVSLNFLTRHEGPLIFTRLL